MKRTHCSHVEASNNDEQKDDYITLNHSQLGTMVLISIHRLVKAKHKILNYY